MPLRCLLFSSKEEVRPPIWQILAELGIEGEYCPRAVDAVERVTTQLFQIVITDWEDQPEAAFLLKTARDLKATQRPLTLAIVGDDAKVPEALQAGANSVLLKPVRVEQVRDTMSTACQLLRSKQSFVVPAAVAAPAESPSATASFKPVSASAAPARARVPEPTEKAFRAGEFLVSSAPAPSAQFDTESDVQLDQAGPVEVEALTELEPMASAVEKPSAKIAESKAPLTGWVALQERLMRSGVQKAPEAPKNELLTYGEMSAPIQPQVSVLPDTDSDAEKLAETKAEDALFAYMEGAPAETAPPRNSGKTGKILFVGIAVASLALIAVPPTRQRLQANYRNLVRLGRNWLNPQPVPVPQVAPQHETFTADEEYKLPATPNIPDATTDPSQIRVIPVIDPTVKPKNSADGGSTAQSTADGRAPDQSQSSPAAGGQALAVDSSVKPQASPNLANAAPTATVATSAPPSLTIPKPQPSAPAPAPAAAAPPQRVPTPSSTAPSTPSAAPATASTAIPASLRSQLAPATPDAGGTKPVDSAMAAIEPVNLPESAAWDLLAQKVDPSYPDAAKGAGQRGSVALQVLIGRDGTVQDAKFLQGSFIFAQAAIDAVKQWRFKPYLLNGRPVSVQSVVTLNFKPSA